MMTVDTNGYWLCRLLLFVLMTITLLILMVNGYVYDLSVMTMMMMMMIVWCFTSISTLLKSYQDYGSVILKDSVQ